MPSSALALQQAIYTTLTADLPLTAALGGPRVYDETPQPVSFPYLTFGPSTVRDGDTASDTGDEHLLVLTVWSRAYGRTESHSIVDCVRAALHDRPLVLTAHRLINIRHEATDTRRNADGVTIQSNMRFRAVTEPT